MPHQDDRSFLRVDNSLRRRDVVGERSERDLDGSDEIPVSFENRNDSAPAACVRERAVDKHNRRFGGIGYGSGREAQKNECQCQPPQHEEYNVFDTGL